MCPLRKYERGFEAFKRNTGEHHPLASRLGHSNKRSLPEVSLTYYANNSQNMMWYGDILVGTPATTYTG
jgi:hypothetical protein